LTNDNTAFNQQYFELAAILKRIEVKMDVDLRQLAQIMKDNTTAMKELAAAFNGATKLMEELDADDTRG
jgi:ABC-type proline/glycine betaine transport system substrate-binding protein